MASVKDPVCGMAIDPTKAAAVRAHQGKTYYLCSRQCLDKFDGDPRAYAR